MIHPIDIVIRTIFPPAKPRDDIDYIIKQIKEVPSPPEREPKEGECDIRKPGAACFADMQEDLVSADDGIQDGYLDVNPSDSITGETIGANGVKWVNTGVNWFNMDTVDNANGGCMTNEPITTNAKPIAVIIGESEFNTNPEILSPLNIDTSLVTDAYQDQNAPEADLIGGEANQGVDSYQAHGERYEVLA